jgi:hypothetical protein
MNTEFTYNALDHDPPSMKRKGIRGGSWKDIGYYLQNGTRTYEYQDTAKSYIGFRSVMNYLGRGGPNKKGTFKFRIKYSTLNLIFKINLILGDFKIYIN